MKRLFFAVCSVFALVALFSAPAVRAAEKKTVEITISDHRFQPDVIKIPADTQVMLKVKNADATPEEFESNELKIEKIIPGKSKGIVIIPPLKPGTYGFVGEFHEETAKGKIIVE